MNDFSIVQAHFRKLRCTHCQQAFAPEGVKLLRQEKDYWVVRVHCLACQRPSGIAVVGADYQFEGGGEPQAPEQTAGERNRLVFTSQAEAERFETMKPISADEMLDAFRFIQSLDAGWTKLLPKV